MGWSVATGLEGQGVIVTGAAGGIGRATAEAFATAGARVRAVDLHQAAADEVVGGMDGGGHIAVGLDLRDLDAHRALIARARDELGSLKALAHLAAVLARQDTVDDVTEADWDLQLDTNLKASFFLARTAADAMIEAGAGGSITLFSSQGWWTGGFGGSVVYCASKGGIVSMTRGLARTYGPHQIRVNAIAPGLVDTPMLMDDLAPEVFESLKAATPLKRVADPSELGGVVVFLASDHASYVSGATLNVSGGFLMY